MSATAYSLHLSKPIKIADYGHIGKEYFATVLPRTHEEAARMQDATVDIISTTSDARVLARVDSFVPFKLADIEEIMHIQFSRYDISMREMFELWKLSGQLPEPEGQYPPVHDMWPVTEPIEWAMKLLKHTGCHPNDIVFLFIFKTIYHG